MSKTVEVFATFGNDNFSQYFGIEDSGKLFLKKDSWNIGPEYCVIDIHLTRISKNSASIFYPNSIREVWLDDILYSSHSFPKTNPHFTEVEAYSRRRQEILDKLPTA